MRCASRSARSWCTRSRWRPTSSSRCRIPACPRRSAMPRLPAFPSSSASSRNHYVGRTFIQPTDSIRHLGVKLKHSPNSQIIKGKRIILVDDSIVRGTTSKKIVDMMRHAGAKRGAYAHLLAAHRVSLLLRHRHAGTRTPDGGAHDRTADGGGDRLRQPRLHLHGRALPRRLRRGARGRAPAVLRRLLLRRLSAGAHRPRPRPALPARACWWNAARGRNDRRGPTSRRTRRPWSPGRPRGIGAGRCKSLRRGRGPRWWRSPAPRARSPNSTTRCRPLGLPPLVLVPADMTDGKAVDAVAAAIAARFGRLDILLHAAAIPRHPQPDVPHRPARVRTRHRHQPHRKLAHPPRRRPAAAPAPRPGAPSSSPRAQPTASPTGGATPSPRPPSKP